MRILSCGKYLPERRLTNEHLAGINLFDYDIEGNRLSEEPRALNAKDIFRRTGILERRVARSDESVADMGFQAAKKALLNAQIESEKLSGVYCATISGDRTPSVASQIAARLGCKRVWAEDVNAACAGFPRVLEVAYREDDLQGKYYLVVASERLYDLVGGDDVNRILFGDAAGAVVVGPDNHFKDKRITGDILNFDKWGIQEGNPLIGIDETGYLRMPDGRKVFDYAVSEMTLMAEELGSYMGIQSDAVIKVIPHQANGRIVSGIARRLGSKYDVFNNIKQIGNVGAASSVIALRDAWNSGFIDRGDFVALTTLGAGLNVSGVLLQFN